MQVSGGESHVCAPISRILWTFWNRNANSTYLWPPPSAPAVPFYFLSALTKLTIQDSSEPFLVFNCVQEYDIRTCHSREQEAWLLINPSMVPTLWDSRNTSIIINKASLEDYTVTNLCHQMLKKPWPLFSIFSPSWSPEFALTQATCVFQTSSLTFWGLGWVRDLWCFGPSVPRSPMLILSPSSTSPHLCLPPFPPSTLLSSFSSLYPGLIPPPHGCPQKPPLSFAPLGPLISLFQRA